MGNNTNTFNKDYKKAKESKHSTGKNIKTSINKLFRRNETLFGSAGKKFYDPLSKQEDGGDINNQMHMYPNISNLTPEELYFLYGGNLSDFAYGGWLNQYGPGGTPDFGNPPSTATKVATVPQGYKQLGVSGNKTYYDKEAKQAVSSGSTSGAPSSQWENAIKQQLQSGVSPEELVKKGHISQSAVPQFQQYYKPVYTEKTPPPPPPPPTTPTPQNKTQEFAFGVPYAGERKDVTHLVGSGTYDYKDESGKFHRVRAYDLPGQYDPKTQKWNTNEGYANATRMYAYENEGKLVPFDPNFSTTVSDDKAKKVYYSKVGLDPKFVSQEEQSKVLAHGPLSQKASGSDYFLGKGATHDPNLDTVAKLNQGNLSTATYSNINQTVGKENLPSYTGVQKAYGGNLDNFNRHNNLYNQHLSAMANNIFNKGGSLSGAPGNGQPTEREFFQQTWIPPGPVGFYKLGGQNTDEIAFPQQVPANYFFAGVPWQNDLGHFAFGGGLPGGANEMPCLECGGYMEMGGDTEFGGNVSDDMDYFEKGGNWIQKATASIKRRGTEGVCTGSKFGGPSCPPGSKRYNLAKTFRAMAKKAMGGANDAGLDPQGDYTTNMADKFKKSLQTNFGLATADDLARQAESTAQNAAFQQTPMAANGYNMGYDPYGGYNPQAVNNYMMGQNMLNAMDKKAKKNTSQFMTGATNFLGDFYNTGDDYVKWKLKKSKGSPDLNQAPEVPNAPTPPPANAYGGLYQAAPGVNVNWGKPIGPDPGNLFAKGKTLVFPNAGPAMPGIPAGDPYAGLNQAQILRKKVEQQYPGQPLTGAGMQEMMKMYQEQMMPYMVSQNGQTRYDYGTPQAWDNLNIARSGNRASWNTPGWGTPNPFYNQMFNNPNFYTAVKDVKAKNNIFGNKVRVKFETYVNPVTGKVESKPVIETKPQTKEEKKQDIQVQKQEEKKAAAQEKSFMEQAAEAKKQDAEARGIPYAEEMKDNTPKPSDKQQKILDYMKSQLTLPQTAPKGFMDQAQSMMAGPRAIPMAGPKVDPIAAARQQSVLSNVRNQFKTQPTLNPNDNPATGPIMQPFSQPGAINASSVPYTPSPVAAPVAPQASADNYDFMQDAMSNQTMAPLATQAYGGFAYGGYLPPAAFGYMMHPGMHFAGGGQSDPFNTANALPGANATVDYSMPKNPEPAVDYRAQAYPEAANPTMMNGTPATPATAATPADPTGKYTLKGKQKRNMDGQNIYMGVMGALSAGENLALRPERAAMENYMNQQMLADNLNPEVGSYRGNKVATGSGYGTQFGAESVAPVTRNGGMIYANGGAYETGVPMELTDDEIQAIMAAGGTVRYI